MAQLEITKQGNDVINLFAKFELQELTTDWINFIINSDFSEVEDLPFQFEQLHCSTNFAGLFNTVNGRVREYVDVIQVDYNNKPDKDRAQLSFMSTSSIYDAEYEESDECSKFWINMTKTFNMKSILSFLFYFNYRGNHFSANQSDRELSILSANLYFLLLAIPGSNAFQVFHPVLYTKCIDTLKLTTKLNVAGAVQKKTSAKSQRSSSDERNEILENEVNTSSLEPSEANKLIRLLNILLNDFMRFTKIFSLKISNDLLEDTISVLVQVTRCETQNAKEVFLTRHSANSTAALCYNSYVALQGLCIPLHGTVKKILTLIMKYVLPSILMTFYGCSEFSTRALGIIKEHSTIYIKYLMFQLKDDTFDGVFILIQHLCVRVPDKAEFRDKVAKTVVELARIFPDNRYSECMSWLFQFSYNEKANHRLFTLEVISKLLAEEERGETLPHSSPIPVDTDATRVSAVFPSVNCDHQLPIPVNREILSHKFLLCIIFSRCRDVAATVRSKALALLAECTLSNQPTIVSLVKQIFLQREPIVFTTPNFSHIGNNMDASYNSTEMTFPNADVITAMLHKRSRDSKVTVRKSALQVIENLLKLDGGLISDALLQDLLDHCRDSALLIRKQMIQSLSSVVQTYPSNDQAVEVWVRGVLPLSLDPESKVQEKVVEFFDQLICHRLCHYEKSSFTDDEILPWKIFDAVNRLSFHKFLIKIFQMWSKSEYLRPKLLSIIESHVDKEFNYQAWSFLALVSPFLEVKKPTFALEYIEEKFINRREIDVPTAKRVLDVLCHSIKHVDENRALEAKKVFLDSVSSFSIDVQLIPPIINVVTLITFKLEGSDEGGVRAVEKWATPILKACDDYLKQILFPKKPSALSLDEEENMFRYLFTLGEVAQLCPSKVNKRMFLMLQSIIFHQKGGTAVRPEDVQIPSTQTQSSQPPSISFKPTTKLQNLAVVTIAKMCLQHEDQAKRIIPAMGRILESTSIASLKVNIVVALSDMCVRYATLVDPLMPQVTVCLRDPDVVVRRTTLTLLINLLQEDYLKLKESFFYRILQCLCDVDEEVRNTVTFYMTERLLKRSPKVFLQHFIECIFHYNAYEEHESYNKFSQSRQEKEKFSLVGAKHQDQRMMLYRFMLDHMQDEHRFATTQRLCQDVLGGVVDGRIRLTPSSQPMLEDTLMVLSSEEIKLAWLRSGPEDTGDQPVNHDDQAEMAGIAIKKTIISQVVKRNVIENIVPILIALKHKFEENRSPLMKQLLLYFREIMKDYKNEVKEILTGDKLISKEIEFDLRRLEEEEQAEALMNAQKKSKQLKGKVCDQQKASIGNSPRLRKKNQSDEDETSSDDDTDSDYPGSEDPGQPADDRGEGVVAEKESASVLEESTVRRLQPTRRSSRTLTSASLRRDTLLRNQEKILTQLGSMQTSERLPVQTSERLPVQTSERLTVQIPSTEVVSSQVEGGGRLNEPLNAVQIPISAADQREEGTLAKSKDATMSCEENDSPQQDDPSIPASDVTRNIEPPCIPTTAITPQKELPIKVSEMKESLMRAISTPNPSQKVIKDITFVNATQNLSRISFDDVSQDSEHIPTVDNNETSEANTSAQTLLLHFTSPEAFRKDERFDRMRRGSKEDQDTIPQVDRIRRGSKEDQGTIPQETLSTEGSQPSNPDLQGRKTSAGGFMYSFNREETANYTEETSENDA